MTDIVGCTTLPISVDWLIVYNASYVTNKKAYKEWLYDGYSWLCYSTNFC